jgi:predicted enzyme related to lactoylglutathione lyase
MPRNFYICFYGFVAGFNSKTLQTFKTTKMNPVVHFEMGANDPKRMADFYSKTFGWDMRMMGPEMGDYIVAATSETDENGMVKTPGTINGGFYKKTDDPSSHAPSVVISVDDIHEHMKKVEAAGGKILGGSKTGEPDEIPGVGLWVSFMDTEGNRVSMLQPKRM